MPKQLLSFEVQLCGIQGRVFEMAIKNGYNCEDFIQKFMNSESVAYFDLPYDRLQWAGEEYIFDEIITTLSISKESNNFTMDEAFWTGYVYRYWHFTTGENSREIYAQADAKTMRECYPGFHTLDVVLAIEDLKELYVQKNADPLL